MGFLDMVLGKQRQIHYSEPDEEEVDLESLPYDSNSPSADQLSPARCRVATKESLYQ